MVHWSHKRLVIRNPAIYRSGEEEGRKERERETDRKFYFNVHVESTFFYRGIENKNNNSKNYICYRHTQATRKIAMKKKVNIKNLSSLVPVVNSSSSLYSSLVPFFSSRTFLVSLMLVNFSLCNHSCCCSLFSLLLS